MPSNTIAIGYGDPPPLLSAIITQRTNKSRKSRWMSFVLSNLISLSLGEHSIHRSAEGQQPATGPFDEHINVLQWWPLYLDHYAIITTHLINFPRSTVSFVSLLSSFIISFYYPPSTPWGWLLFLSSFVPLADLGKGTRKQYFNYWWSRDSSFSSFLPQWTEQPD